MEYKQELENRLRATIVTEVPNLTLDDVCGIEEEKSLLKSSITTPIINSKGTKNFSRFLLFGPSGTGKTYLAKAVAGEALRKGREGGKPFTFFSVSPSDLTSRGETGELINALFSLAKRESPSVIFLDNMELLFDSEPTTKPQLKNRLDKMDNNNEPVIFIAATNNLDHLDYSLLKSFQKVFYIPLPNLDVRLQIFNMYFLSRKNFQTNITRDDILLFADLTRDFTCDEIVWICKNEKNKEDVRRAIISTRLSTAPSDIKKFNNFATEKTGWIKPAEYSELHEPGCMETILCCVVGTFD